MTKSQTLFFTNFKTEQQDFLNSIIHELKTPLNAIIGFSEILKNEVRDPKAVEECFDYADEINKVANDLNEIINDLLDVGSIASRNFVLDLSKKIDVKEIIKRSIKLNRDFSVRRKVSLKEEIAADIDLINLDCKRMKQILCNLISNSIKYSPENTEVAVLAKNILKNEQNFLQIIVADQGFGMNEDQVKTAFEKYQTIENPNSGIVDSFGLGLPITKQLVELQNGRISVKSEVGKGSEFILEFPYLKQ
ncbi:MAG: HAMP domain-containing histidine kinase [Pelagibacterales bacterium]|nr:HAMP domain-containing histidine kinase [Pelagibacterales bacterium]